MVVIRAKAMFDLSIPRNVGTPALARREKTPHPCCSAATGSAIGEIGTRFEELNKRWQVAKQRLPERLRRLLCFRAAKRGLFAMDFFQLDDSSVSVIAMVAG